MKIIFTTYIRLAESLQKPWEEVVIFIPGSRPYAGFPLTGYLPPMLFIPSSSPFNSLTYQIPW